MSTSTTTPGPPPGAGPAPAAGAPTRTPSAVRGAAVLQAQIGATNVPPEDVLRHAATAAACLPVSGSKRAASLEGRALALVTPEVRRFKTLDVEDDSVQTGKFARRACVFASGGGPVSCTNPTPAHTLCSG